MSPTIFLAAVIAIAALLILGVTLYTRRVKAGLKGPESMADYFSPRHVKGTAMQLGLIRSLSDPLPGIDYQDNKKGEYDILTFTPRRGDTISKYEGLSQQLRTFTGAVKADSIVEGNTVLYRLWKSAPDESALVEAINWDPSYIQDWTGDLSRVPVGIDVHRDTYYMRANAHTLLIGMSGSGKASLIWSLVGALHTRPEVELWGIDLKGGVEFGKARHLFKNVVTNSNELLDGIIKLEAEMEDRLEEMLTEGEDKWTPTPEYPQIFLIADEVNAIPRATDAMTPTDRKRFNKAWENILSQGRAPGISVFAAAQDPRGGSLPARQLFTQFISLRTSRPGDQDILFGDTESKKIADASRWTGNQNAASGRAMLKDEDAGGSYRQFKIFYVDKAVVQAWNLGWEMPPDGSNPAEVERFRRELALEKAERRKWLAERKAEAQRLKEDEESTPPPAATKKSPPKKQAEPRPVEINDLILELDKDPDNQPPLKKAAAPKGLPIPTHLVKKD